MSNGKTMRILVTAGPTREYIDSVRFISNGSSGKMGCAVAIAAAQAGHEVTLLLGPGIDPEQLLPDSACRYARPIEPDNMIPRPYGSPTDGESDSVSKDDSGIAVSARRGITIVRFVSVADLKLALRDRFADCDALVMTAAVGDFRVDNPSQGKISRSGGPITITLIPTEDVLASIAAGKKPNQIVVSFAVETGPRAQIELKARRELLAKHADMVVVNTPQAMAAPSSQAAILSSTAELLAWADRPKEALAREIIRLIEQRAISTN